MYIKRTLILLLLIFSVYSCAVKKYIPDGKYLYRGGDIKLENQSPISDKSVLNEELEAVFYPEPNSKFLGMYPGLHYYYKAQTEHPGFIARFLNKKIGEKPAYLSQVKIDETKDLIQNRLENNGFFYENINSSVEKDSVKKTAHIDYTVNIKKPYQLKTYQIEKDSTDTLSIYKEMKNSLVESEIKKGQRFNLHDLKDERERIDDYLKARGYYYFNKDFILFEADTNRYDNRDFDLYLKLKEGTPEKSKVPYVLDSVFVYPSVINDTVYGVKDTTRIKNVDFVQGKMLFKPHRLRPFVLLEPGQKYNPEYSKFTSRRLSSIGNYKFVNIYYVETDSVLDSLGNRHLKSIITLSPLPRNAFQFKVQGVTKSNDFTGPGVELAYTNRNIFKGGENFVVKGNLGYEKQFYKGDKAGSSSLHFGVQPSLTFPRLLFPGNYDDMFKYAIPQTKISLGFDYLRRSNLYGLNSFSTAFGYIWEQNRFVTHRLKPISIDYVRLNHTSSKFEDILDENPFLKHSFDQQFIAGLLYSFTYNELSEKEKRGRLYFQYNFDIAGNTISLFAKRHPGDVKTFLDLRYAQYVKTDIDLSYHYDLGHARENTLVGHVFAGFGMPYGNSKALPFVKQYFAGGPYSIRAFRIRSIGPGTYEPPADTYSYFDQAGDIRFEANFEYRFPIYSIFKGALFADAGNVWLKNKNENLPGGEITTNFYKQLAYGAGFGLRVDIQSFVLRFDLASPLKRPNGSWNFEYKKPVFNFAIGYPF